MKRVYTVIAICLFASLFTLAKSVDGDIPSNNILEAGGPTVTITLNAGQNSPTNASPVVFRAVFNEAVTGFATGDVTTSASTVGGTLTATVAEIAPNDGTTFTISVTGMTTSGNVIVTIAADVCNATGPPGKLNQPSVNVNNTVAYDSAPPAAFTVGSVITTGGTVVAGRWNASNTGVDVTVPIANDASLTGGSLQLQARVTTGSFANIGAAAAIVIGDLGGSKTISLTDVQFEGISTFGDGKIVEVRAVITDLAGNATTGSNSATTITVDQTSPGSFTVGSVVTTGGTIKAGYWNSTNTGVNVTVPIANDATLNGGTVQLQARIASGTFASIGSPSAIASVNTTKIVSLTDAEFEAITGFTNGETIQVRAIITDIAGNSTTGTQSATTIIVDQNPPIAFTVGSVITTGGTIVAGYWNSSNTGVDVTVPVDNDATLTGGAVQLQARVTTGTFANIGPSSVVNVGDLGNSKTFSLTSVQFEAITGFAEAKIVEIRAVITDIASNSTTGTQSATTITVDQVGPGLTLTKPAASSYVNNTQVTYTISETLSAATITWTRTGGTADSNHPQALTGAELTTNQTDYTLTNNPTLVNGSVYTVAFSSSDASGNTTTVSNTLVTYDTTPPSAPSTVSVTATGGNVVANYWNGSNTGVNLGINIPNDNSLVNGTVQIEASSNGTTWNTIASSSSATISSVNTTKTMSITSANIIAISGYAQSVSLRFRARLIDQAGNGPSAFTTSATQLFVDTVKPTINSADFFASLTASNDPSFTDCGGTAISQTTTREFVHILMSEPMSGANGALPTIGSPGFAASAGVFDVVCSNRGGSAFHPTNVIHLQNEFITGSTDGAWDGNTTFSFTAGGTNVTDVAGNELASVPSIVPGDSNAPKLATGLVFFPNGTGPETIVFQLDETLNAAVTNNVTGFTTSVGTINILLTNYNSTTKTVTLTSTADGMWTDAVTLSYDQLTGNVTDPANNELAAFGGLSPNPAEPIFLKGVHISSNNTTNAAYATVGNTITIGFTASRTLSALPIVTIGGLAANVALIGGLTYSATLVATAGVPDGPITFQIDVTEVNTATTVTATTDDSTIKFDKTAPTVVLSDNHADNIVRDADLVTITATFTELNGLNAIPTISISQTSPVITNAAMIATLNPLIWTYTWDVPAGAVNDGTVNVTIATTDPAGNANSAATGKNSYTIDNTPPTVTIATSSALLGFGTNGTTATSVNFLLTFSETVPTTVLASDISVNTGNEVNIFDAYPGVGFNALVDGNITGSGITRTVSVTGLSGTGWLKINLNDADNTVTDVAGNPAVDYFTSFTFPGTEAYTRVLPQPSNPITSPTTTRTGTTLTVNWSDAFAPAQQATHYLVMIKKTTVGAFPAVTDGTYMVNDFDLTDNILKQNITFGTTVASFTGLPLTDTYDVIIYPYTLSPNNGSSNINFGTATQVSGSSDIIQNFNYTGNDNILYKDFVEPILTSSSKTLEVFDLRDGGGSADADALPTILSGITLNITNWENLNQLGLFSGATLVQQVAVTGPIVVFNSLGSTFQAADDGSATITVKGSFKTIVDDNEVVTFSVSSVTASTVSSSQFLTTTPTGATVTSDATGTQNKIEVVATRIDYTTVPASASISVPLTIQVSARDANANLDADYNGSITATSNTNTGSFTTANDPTGAFTAGIKDYPANYQFTTGNGNVQLTINSGAGSGAGNINAAAISGTSPVISVISSFDSWLYFDPSFTYTPRIDFANKQEDPIVSTSQPLARLILSDGGSATSAFNLFTNPNPGLKNQATHQDSDGSFTKIDAFTISLTNFQDIRKIALYASDGVTKIGSDKTPAATVTFTGLSSYFAPDNGTYTYYIRASFNQTVTDLDQIAMQVTAVTHNSGSKFSEQQTIPPPTIAGVDGAGAFGDSSPLTGVNILDVIATSLDFTTQPSSYAGINEPIDGSTGGSTGIVKAQDIFANLDTEFNSSASVTAPANPISYPANFSSGVLNLSGMQYKNAGIGTLKVTANGLDSDNSADNSNVVDVIHVTASKPQNPNNGVVTSPSLKGGTSNIVIFGFDIYPEYSTAAEPELKEFSIQFGKPYKTSTTTIFKNFKVFESLNGTYAGSTNVTTIVGTTIEEDQSPALVLGGAPLTTKDMVKVTFPVGNYRSLKSRNQSTPITYFLVVDIDATANLNTDEMTPQLVDGGYYSQTNNGIITTIGSSDANVIGTTFKFASTRPPSLKGSIPANGALNVDSLQSTIKLYFDVGVWSHDQQIVLWERSSNTVVDTLKLVGTNGFYPGAVTDPKTTPPIPLTFQIPYPDKLVPDSVYYVTIAKGTFDNNTKTGTGISDDGFNLYGGISYNGELYFKIASKKPPVMVSTDSNKYYESATGASINASFDQKEGTAYFMVVTQNSPAPTNDMIKGTDLSYIGMVARGQFKINQVDPNLNSGIFNIAPSGVSRTFDVWMYAENGAPIPVATKKPYGKLIVDADPNNDYVEGAAGPTFKVTIPAATSSVYLNRPVYQICANSTVTLVDPIIIEESTAKNEFSGGAQNFNLLLPSGFTFDIKSVPVVQISSGADFTGGISTLYVNSTILRVSFSNTGNTSQDKIIISNLRVTANANDLTGRIIRFAGNAFPLATASLGDGTVLAGIASSSATAFEFNNSYTTSNDFDLTPISITNPVTAIPDNYVDPDPNLNPFTVRLSPQVPKGDYGPSSFSGNGVTNDVLSLSAVTLNTAFDITMNHVDMNGCISTKVVQYEVYDHTQAIPALVDSTYGTKDFVINPDYLLGSPPPPFSNLADSVGRNFKAGYNMIELFANIPATATQVDTTNTTKKSATDQIMFGTEWEKLVNQIPIKKDSSDFNTTLGEYYRSYYWYYGVLLSNSTLDPYKYFDAKTAEGRPYYRGGSLGLVEFTGKFRSTADATVLIPIRQEIEVFIPAIPVVEIAKKDISGFDIADPLKPDPNLWPDGTPIFCQGGVSITINGYPAATAGVSAGSFDIVDASNERDTLYSSKTAAKRYGGFVDNGNGTAFLTPGQLKNSAGRFANDYKDIRIVYTFKDNASPIAGSGDLIIRISPNPTANFLPESVLDTTAISMELGRPADKMGYCEDNTIIFKNISTFPATGYTAETSPSWTLGDPLAAKNKQDSITAVFKYSTNGKYTVTFQVSSQFNCPSSIVPKDIYVGAIPDLKFNLTGLSTETPITVADISTVNSGGGSKSSFLTPEWYYGDSAVNVNPAFATYSSLTSHSYTKPGHYKITLKATTKITDDNNIVTSSLGCERILSRDIIIVPSALSGAENFESNDPIKQWQTSSTDTLKSSWVRGVSKKDSLRLKTNVWITKIKDDYNPNEESYLYSPVYDLSSLARPMISFDQASYMAQNDGVVLEFSTDNLNVADPLKKWFRLGKEEEGTEWYNKSGLASKPGTQLEYPELTLTSGDYGWSYRDTLIRSSRHSLSPDLPSYSQVVFRFVLKSVEERVGDQGFAIDNFRIGDRTRTVLIENFTNKGTSNPDEKTESDYLKTKFPGVVGTDYIKINYHVGFPGVDPFNTTNPADPSARALYYNVSKTPTAFLDSYDDPIPLNSVNRLFSKWGETVYGSQSLELAGADITITATLLPSNTYSVSVSVTAKKDLPASTILHTGFLEAKIISTSPLIKTGETEFEYVLKKLLPSAAGTRFGAPLLKDQTKTFGPFEWTIDPGKLFPNANDLAAVAFLQDESTKEVHQSALKSGLTDPSVVTGIEAILPEQVNVYPNPASSEFRIELPAIVQNEARLHLIDMTGRKYDKGMIPSGGNSATVNVEDLTEGIYILEIGAGSTGIIRKKIMVVMKN